MGDPAADLCSPFVGGQSHRRRRFRTLTRRKLGQGREDELRLSDLLAGVSYAQSTNGKESTLDAGSAEILQGIRGLL
jgi:hypothetical protein